MPGPKPRRTVLRVQLDPANLGYVPPPPVPVGAPAPVDAFVGPRPDPLSALGKATGISASPEDMQRSQMQAALEGAAPVYKEPTLREPTWTEWLRGKEQDLWEALAAQPAAKVADMFGVSGFGAKAEELANPDPWRYGVVEPPETPEGDLAGAVRGIRAYHGSPHRFEKFDFSKIGSGEGAAAYGHGGYFAEAEGVAKDYKHRLGGQTFTYQGERVDPHSTLGRALDFLNSNINMGEPMDVVLPRRIQNLRDHARYLREAGNNAWRSDEMYDAAADTLATLKPSQLSRGGHLYEVNIDVDPAHLLDWDKRLADQSPYVQQALAGVQAQVEAPWVPHQVEPHEIGSGRFPAQWRPGGWTSVQLDPQTLAVRAHAGQTWPTRAGAAENAASRNRLITHPARDRGHQLYHDLPDLLADQDLAPRLSDVGRDVDASRALLERGVPGLKYLDQGSRGKANLTQAANGNWFIPGSSTPYATRAEAQAALDASGQVSRNIVMFPGTEHLIDILRKYGFLPPLVGGAALQTLSNSGQSDQVAAPPPVRAPR